MISAINHVTLSVRDIDEAFQFYRKVLQLKPLAKRRNKSAYFLAGEDWIALVQAKADFLPSSLYAHLAFSVSPREFEAVSERIKLSGATIWQENSSPGESLYFLDPSGNRLEVHTGSWRSRVQWLKDNPCEEVELFEEGEVP